MTTTAQAGIFGFGPQAAKGTAVPTNSWYRHKATMVDLAALDDQRLGPPEVGGRPLPTIPYKGGIMVGGGATINPRLENSLGWLLYGALGYHSQTSGSGNIKLHTFKLDDTNPGLVRWMGFRKYIPASSDVGDYVMGETYKDCKVTNIVFTLPNDGLISSRVDCIGREFELTSGSNCTWGTISGSAGGWAADGEFEDYESIPIGTVLNSGYISVPTFGNLPVVQGQIGIQNVPLDARSEKVYGSPYLEDVTIISRSVTLDLTVKWRNPDLYRQILTGSTTGTVWSATPFTTSVTMLASSPTNMPGESTPYYLQMTATKAMLALTGGIQLAGNQAVLMRFTGTCLDTVGDYVSFVLANQVANYTWPT